MRRISIPDEVVNDPEALEILCVWVLPTDDIGFVTTENPWTDPAALGILFADIARHYFKVGGMPEAEWGRALRRVISGIEAELEG